MNLLPCTTLALPGYAAASLIVDRLETLHAHKAEIQGASRRFILGGGSNVVLTGDFPGLLLKVELRGKERLGEDADAVYVRAAAGENWHDFVQWTLAQGWPGLENLSLIPGTVGAAPIQNIGAYGLEAGELLHEVEAIDLADGSPRRFDHAACRFGYRDSVFKQQGWHLDGRLLITAVTFRLPKRWQPRTGYADVAKELAERSVVTPTPTPTPTDIAAAVIAIRQRKLPDPAVLPNAGSFFKNPVVDAATAARLAAAHGSLPNYPQPDGTVKLAAGWLIEQAGWKGRSLGPVGMYEKQALILVNHGGATGADVQALTAAVQADVQQRFGVALEAEPVFIGHDCRGADA